MMELSREDLKDRLIKGCVEAELSAVEFKEKWTQDTGKDISAIANKLGVDTGQQTGWIVIGVTDSGNLGKKDLAWAKKQEVTISSALHENLSPSWATNSILVENVNGNYCVFIEVINLGDLVRWRGDAYKLVGTTSHKMSAAEELEVSLKMPGADYSKAKYDGHIDASLVSQFAQKVNESGREDFSIDIENSTPSNILANLNILNLNASGILFGDFKFRVAHIDENGDVLDQKELKGLQRMLSDEFVDEIQSWTRRKGTDIKGNSVVAPEESPYPPKALREILANAVAHAYYQKDGGDIKVELYPDRITVSNYCAKDAKAFVNKWLSRSHKTNHKHLMNTLRIANVTDELGSGKIRIFRYMLEYGKREPVVSFEDLGQVGRWSISLYNDEENTKLKNFFNRLTEIYKSSEQAKVAQALLLWRKRTWPEILSYLDENYKWTVDEVLKHRDSPVLRYGDRVFTRRWAAVALDDGQITKEFSEAEKGILLQLLKSYAYGLHRDGHISSLEAKQLIGLSNTKQESGQIGKLFLEWKDRGIVKKVKKAQWQFTEEPTWDLRENK